MSSKRRKKRTKKKKNPPVAKPKSQLDEEKEEIENMQNKLSSDWLAFSLSSSPWIRFSVSPEIESAFSSDVGASEPEKKQWLFRAESSIMEWVISDMILKEPDRAVQFRNLGRGWVFVLVRRHKRIFKVWFESIRRVEWNHQMDIRTVNLTGKELTKYTRGYLHESEVVFFVKGMVLYGADRSQTSTQGTISIQKFRTDYRGLGKWIGGNQQVQEKCRTSGDLTDEERKMISARTLRKQKKKAQKIQKNLLAADAAPDTTSTEAEAELPATPVRSATARPVDTAFLKLLESFKMEDARRRDDHSAVSFSSESRDWKKEGDTEFKGEVPGPTRSTDNGGIALKTVAKAEPSAPQEPTVVVQKSADISVPAAKEEAAHDPSTNAAAAGATTRSRRSGGRRRRRRKRNKLEKKEQSSAAPAPESSASAAPQPHKDAESATAAAPPPIAAAEQSTPDKAPAVVEPAATAEVSDVGAAGVVKGSESAPNANFSGGRGSLHIERWFND